MKEQLTQGMAALAFLPFLVSAQATEDFSNGDGGWSAGPMMPSQIVEQTGGNAGAWLRCPSSTGTPEWYGPRDSLQFTGDFRARGVTQVSCDVRQDSALGTFGTWLLLISDPDPLVPFDEAIIGIPATGNPQSPAGGTGWQTTTFDFDASAPSPPAGSFFLSLPPQPPDPNFIWNSVIRDVAMMEIHWATNPIFDMDPPLMPPGWDFGIDNITITEGFATEFCFGDGSTPPFCGTCPCSNESPAGSGAGCSNSSGGGGRLAATGSGSVGTPTLQFDFNGGPPNQLAVLFSGSTAAPAEFPATCFGFEAGIDSIALDGKRCVVNQVVRHGTRALDMQGDALSTWDLGLPGFANGAFVAGQSRQFQVIYTDPPSMSNCGTGLNSSQAVSIYFVP